VSELAFMRRALELAERGRGLTSPNPLVGAVVVRHGAVVGEGAHLRAGGPHAEIEALSVAGDAARGATLYVTLEPCAHHGRTPPCAPAVLRAGLSRSACSATRPSTRTVPG
jgi:diaminohydroxyphosphoribosylaminopyrimidine deaminase / 5-amino-6-(5-phosphoribosylamino)uracil reductase